MILYIRREDGLEEWQDNIEHVTSGRGPEIHYDSACVTVTPRMVVRLFDAGIQIAVWKGSAIPRSLADMVKEVNE